MNKARVKKSGLFAACLIAALAVLQQEAGTKPEDFVVVTRDVTGRISVNQSTDMATGLPLGGGRWGTMIGILFLDSRKPVPNGKGLSSQLLATGLEEGFLRSAGQALEMGTAVVGLRVRLLGADRVLNRIKALKDTPKVLRTRLDAVTGCQADFKFDNLVPDGIGALMIGYGQQFAQAAAR